MYMRRKKGGLDNINPALFKNKNSRLSMYIDASLKELLRVEADKMNLTITSLVVSLITNFIQEKQEKRSD